MIRLISVKFTVLSLAVAGLLGVGACGSIKPEAKYPTGYDRNETGGDIYGERQTIWGPGKTMFGRGKNDVDDGSTGIGVNSYLWRASLDTVSFMPLASADPFGGTILTDWYTDPDTPNERVKVNVFILGRQLRSDGVRVRVFKQVARKNSWFDTEASDETARQLEDAILTRARQLRVAQSGND